MLLRRLWPFQWLYDSFIFWAKVLGTLAILTSCKIIEYYCAFMVKFAELFEFEILLSSQVSRIARCSFAGSLRPEIIRSP